MPPESAADGHADQVAQPHDSEQAGPIAEAEVQAAEISDSTRPLGKPGRPFDRRSPFMIGVAAAAGVAVTYGVVLAVVQVADVLILLGLALFLAVGLEPAVSWLVRKRFPRWLAVLTVFVVVLGAVGGFLTAAIPVVVEQATQFAAKVPGYLAQAQDHNSWLGKLNDRFHLQQTVEGMLNNGAGISGGLLGIGQAVFGVLTDTLVLIVLTVYFVADFPRIRAGLYRLVPHSRRPRVILLGDEIFTKVGSYVLGNLAISVIAGVLTLIWLLITGVPFPALLAITVALLDLVPVAGSIIGGVLVSLVALTVSFPVFLGTVIFFVAYRFLEDYLLVPKIIGGVVKVPALVTVVAVLLGATLLGVIGALVAIPIAAAVLLIAKQVVYPVLDRS